MNNQYDTLSEAVSCLQKKGYIANFYINKQAKLGVSGGKKYAPKDVKIVEFHRFEGMTNPSDSSIIYAVVTYDGKKGTIIDAYGANGAKGFSEFIKKVT